jgi:hypothetical protein
MLHEILPVCQLVLTAPKDGLQLRIIGAPIKNKRTERSEGGALHFALIVVLISKVPPDDMVGAGVHANSDGAASKIATFGADFTTKSKKALRVL